MAKQILRDKLASLQVGIYYTVIIDETTDTANKEQVLLMVRWVDDSFNAHEEFIGLHANGLTTAQALVEIIKDILLWLSLKLADCRVQCYDGASTMAGPRTGVAKLLLDEEPRELYTSCYEHALNLAV